MPSSIGRALVVVSLILTVALILFLSSLDLFGPNSLNYGLPNGRVRVIEGERVLSDLSVEIAETPAEQAKTLEGLPRIPKGKGLVLLFGSPTDLPYTSGSSIEDVGVAMWDINSRIVDVQTVPPCSGGRCRLYVPKGTYVGLVKTQVASLNLVKAGNKVELIRSSDG